MAMNPMQRRARTSFIMGFLVALIIGALAVGALLFKIKSINEAKEAIEARQKSVYVTAADLESGDEITMEDFVKGTVQTSMDVSQIISDEDFERTDNTLHLYYENEEAIDNEEDPIEKEVPKKVYIKVNVPAGAIVTKDMIYSEDDEIDDTTRLQEFNCILLPSQLKNNDYIDIRLSLPSGLDFIVLSKKKVLGTNETAIWLNLDELEMTLLNNAIVESYQMGGSKLYAVEYVEAGMQKAAIPTYVASSDTVSAINKNPNIIEEAKVAYANAINGLNEFRQLNIESALDPTRESRDSLVSSGISNEIQSIRAQRKSFVDSLAGTEDIGYSEQ